MCDTLLCRLYYDVIFFRYHKISHINHTKSQNLNGSRLVLQLPLPNPMKTGFQSRMKYVVGAAPTGDAPIASESSTGVLSFKLLLIVDVWRYMYLNDKDCLLDI